MREIMEKNNQKKKGLIIVNIILIILVVCLSGYIIYDKALKENNNINKKENTKDKQYNLDDYIIVTNFEVNKDCEKCNVQGNVKTIEFKSLPSNLISEFNEKHQKFINPSSSEEVETKLSNEINYEINNNLLSVYTKENKTYERETNYNYYSVNIDLNTKTIITNQELLKIYNINSYVMFEKILKNIKNTVTVDKFLLSTTGDITADKISLSEFDNNISTYAKDIENKYDVVTLYLKNNKLVAVYTQSEILSLLKMGTHMNIGLISEPQVIELN